MDDRPIVQTAAMVFGAIYLLAGVAGFLPFLGGSYTQTNSALFSVFQVNLLHNLVHVVIGIAGLASASSLANARNFCRAVGVILLLLGVLGIFAAQPLGLLNIGGLDIALHLVSGALLAYFGFAAPISTRSAS
jgi:Domain of unknown function (DUF4383)